MAITKFNHGSQFDYRIPENTPYINLEKLFCQTNNASEKYVLRSLYVNMNSKFGPAPCAVIDGYVVNLPKYLLQDVEDMLDDAEVIAEINAGKAGFQIRTYENRNGGTSYAVKWVEIK